jgi:hypothetical protein
VQDELVNVSGGLEFLQAVGFQLVFDEADGYSPLAPAVQCSANHQLPPMCLASRQPHTGMLQNWVYLSALMSMCAGMQCFQRVSLSNSCTKHCELWSTLSSRSSLSQRPPIRQFSGRTLPQRPATRQLPVKQLQLLFTSNGHRMHSQRQGHPQVQLQSRATARLRFVFSNLQHLFTDLNANTARRSIGHKHGLNC